jgi:hypothetical protein
MFANHLRCLVLLSMALAATGPARAADKPAPFKPSDDPKTLATQFDAVSNLDNLLETKLHQQHQRNALLLKYLQTNKLTDEFEKIPADKLQTPAQPMTFAHALDEAVKHQKTKPAEETITDEQVPGMQRSMEFFIKDARRKWDELMPLMQKNFALGAWLNDKGKFEDFKAWAGIETSKAQQAAAKAHADEMKTLRAEAKKKAEKQQQEKDQRIQQARADHRQMEQEKLQMRFKLRQQQMIDDTKIKTARFQRNTGWGGWDDDHHYRPYPPGPIPPTPIPPAPNPNP